MPIAGRYQPLDNARPGTPQRARDLQTAQTVVLRDQRLPSAEALARAHAAKGIFHPSLITLFDVVQHVEGRLLLAYEFVPSQPIVQVSGGHPFHAKRAAEIITEVADAVAELHARGIAHGGISQGTVLITMKGKAKLDRVGDPSLHVMLDPDPARDIQAIGDLLAELSLRPSGAAATGGQGVDVVLERIRSGSIGSAATIAGLLRKM